MNQEFELRFIDVKGGIASFVEHIGFFHNRTAQQKEVVVMPDGRVDLFFWQPGGDAFQVLLMGLETAPELRYIPPQSKAFVISFKPLALEYLLKKSIADILNSAIRLPDNYWGFDATVLGDFELFCRKASQHIESLLPVNADPRKLKLFELIYASSGEMSVAELADQCGWSSRQINRYFKQQFGLSLKAYCTILRFRASLKHIARGKLFPELNFTDQAYFIKAVKRFSGVVPKELARNHNDRFLLLSLLKQS